MSFCLTQWVLSCCSKLSGLFITDSKRRREGPNFAGFCKVILLNSHSLYAWMGLCNSLIRGKNCFKENSRKKHIQSHKVLKSTQSETQTCQNFRQPIFVKKRSCTIPWYIKHCAGFSKEVHFLITWLIGLYRLRFDWPRLPGSVQVQGNIWSVWEKNPKKTTFLAKFCEVISMHSPVWYQNKSWAHSCGLQWLQRSLFLW